MEKETKVALLSAAKYGIFSVVVVYSILLSLIFGFGFYNQGAIGTLSAAMISSFVWAPFGAFVVKLWNIASKAKINAEKNPPRWHLCKMETYSLPSIKRGA